MILSTRTWLVSFFSLRDDSLANICRNTRLAPLERLQISLMDSENLKIMKATIGITTGDSLDRNTIWIELGDSSTDKLPICSLIPGTVRLSLPSQQILVVILVRWNNVILI